MGIFWVRNIQTKKKWRDIVCLEDELMDYGIFRGKLLILEIDINGIRDIQAQN